jgi:energy-coupling factor transport system ATP-binding protein
MLIGNAMFSPQMHGGTTFFIFRLNQAGIELGMIGALKRNAMLVISFAWLSSLRSPQDLIAAFPFIRGRTSGKYFYSFLKGLQNLSSDIRDHYYSLIVRGIAKRTIDPRKRVMQLYLVMSSAAVRFFRVIERMTFAGETHFIAALPGARASIMARQLVVRYHPDSDDVLKGISINVGAGDVLCLVGNAESGKTTLLRCLSGYIPRIRGYVVAGEVVLCGDDVGRSMTLAEVSRRIRYVGANSKDFLLGLTVGEEMMAIAETEQLARDCSAAMGISDLWDRETTALSGGQQARLLLASALASQARCFLFDSPLAQLDEVGRSAFLSALTELKNQKEVAIIIADETLDPYLLVATRYAVIDNGRLSGQTQGSGRTACEVYRALRLEVPQLTLRPRDLFSSSPILAQLRDVEMTLGGREVLRDLNLDIRAGECVGLIGTNGSGKTTAMLTLAGIYDPNKGERFAPKIGFVFQNPENQILERTCARELAIEPRVNRWLTARREAFVDESIRALGVASSQPTTDLHPLRTRMLSCLCATADSRILIMDEPSVEMDETAIAWLAQMVWRETSAGKGVVIITHDVRLLGLTNRTAVMSNGAIIANEQDAKSALRIYFESTNNPGLHSLTDGKRDEFRDSRVDRLRRASR